MQALIDLYGTHPFWVWAAIGAAFLAVEVVTGSGWLLWPATSAALVGVLALFVDVGAPWSVLIFAGLTIAATLLARRFILRVAGDGADINDNVARLIGHAGLAAQAFERGAGRVSIDGKEWAAELDGAEALAVGERVEVVGVNGSRLRVRASRPVPPGTP
ncbi:NfeD family protein [Phenylobacterium sp.]|uniref:NfeD family protein n=1 Tax=Phenylobacterium sp. TaxID=1871053 RepID=UPI00273336B5|nr:NfeD family protein [Phenylobacterium sp.]MDP3658868.1 NfeD family protein [Phenylobacterium sp.]